MLTVKIGFSNFAVGGKEERKPLATNTPTACCPAHAVLRGVAPRPCLWRGAIDWQSRPDGCRSRAVRTDTIGEGRGIDRDKGHGMGRVGQTACNRNMREDDEQKDRRLRNDATAEQKKAREVMIGPWERVEQEGVRT